MIYCREEKKVVRGELLATGGSMLNVLLWKQHNVPLALTHIMCEKIREFIFKIIIESFIETFTLQVSNNINSNIENDYKFFYSFTHSLF